MPDLVLEVGTEEMPAGAIEAALGQLRASVESGLTELRLDGATVQVCGTPRRLIVRATNVPERQPDQAREVRGPAKSVAYDPTGKPTGAAMGFAKKQGITVDALEIVSTPQGEYIVAKVTDEGKPSREVLGAMLSSAVLGLTFPKLMRWGRENTRFVRPIRWIFAMLDTEVVPMELFSISSSNRSRGHRFLAPAEFELNHANELLQKLPTVFVATDPVKRRELIREQANKLAAQVGGSIPWDEGLLDENNWLVEWPTALLGHFDEKYLELPRPVLVTAMKKHQRFFPIEDANGKLKPLFIAVRNGGSDHLEIVQDGNERVLTARFSDASFFYSQDKERKLEDIGANLSRLVFQEKLGTIAQKRERLVALISGIAKELGLSADDSAMAARAALLCKADLVSQMVVELPSLQGVMGREYAAAHGEDMRVADAILEHYMPKSAGDAIPPSTLGKLLAVTDRIDTLVGYVGLGILPSGSSDPYGLRRAAQGVVQILATEPNALALPTLFKLAAAGYKQVNDMDIDVTTLTADLGTIFSQRLSAVLQERGVRYDLVDATLAGGSALETVCSTIGRGDAVQALADDAQFIPTVQAAARVSNILKPAQITGAQPDPAAFVTEAETGLYSAAQQVAPKAAALVSGGDFKGLYNALDALRTPVNTFFDDVMVMVDDAAVRANRIALLDTVDGLYKGLADFTKVVTA